MDARLIMWTGVLLGLTAAYVLALIGARAARRGEVQPHARRMMAMSVMIGLWLVGYILKQLLFGIERFNGTTTQYWRWYVPVLSVHILLAFITIGLGVANLYSGLTSLRFGGGVGAMRVGVVRHRQLGRLLMWSFSGTLVTAYAIFFMLFVLFPIER